MRLVRLAILSTAFAAISVVPGGAASDHENGKRNSDCVDACISTQRSCVVNAATVADKSKCSEDNATCSTKCPLPSGGPKH